jgi:N-acetyl-gamma-glutamyl-phosphate reductase
MKPRIALIGGRGYTGAELLGLLAHHPAMNLAFASSGSQAGQPLRSVCPQWPEAGATFVGLEPGQVGQHPADAWVLALPNGAAALWAQAISDAHPHSVIVDLSADYRFDRSWVYGLPELNRAAIVGARRIANPGCYATAAMLGLWPLREILRDTPVLFGVSGYSGAGRAPSPRNDPDTLRDNLMPYSLVGHMHEREVSFQLGREVRFTPHVAAFFRGISMTIAVTLVKEVNEADILATFESHYRGEPRVHVTADVPQVRQAIESPDAWIGGFSVDARDPRRLTMVSVLDNLSKGAASQALQNLNLALGLDEQAGVEHV